MIDIKRFRKDKKIKQSELCEILEISQPFLSAIERGFRPLNEDKFRKLFNHYGEIVLEYKKPDKTIVIESSRNLENKTFKPSLISDLNVTVAPLISQYAQAGFLVGFMNAEFLDRQPVYVATQKYSEGNYVAFEVRGDSMDNEKKDAICSGDVVLGRELSKELYDSKIVVPGLYILVHKVEGVLLREITDYDFEAGIISCRAYNPDKIRFPDFTLKQEEVLGVFGVKELKRGGF